MPKSILYSVVLIAICAAAFSALQLWFDLKHGPPDITRGNQLYLNHCQACHGAKGLGDGPVAVSLKIKPDNIYKELTNPLAYKGELVSSVIEGDNGERGKMPAFRDILSEKDIVNIFAYIVLINQDS